MLGFLKQPNIKMVIDEVRTERGKAKTNFQPAIFFQKATKDKLAIPSD